MGSASRAAQPENRASCGVYEFVFGALQSETDALLKFWQVLGFEVAQEGQLVAADAGRLYGHDSALQSYRLRHPGCNTFDTGLVRLQCWERLRNDGLGNSDPIVTGSRWMGLYTHDILQVRDAFCNPSAMSDWDLWVSPLVNAPLMQPPPKQTFLEPFVGLRETLVFGNRFRLAFIQRGGFDRPGFGTFDDMLPFKNTEGSHANVVQPDNQFSTAFYKAAFGLETAPFGDAHDSGAEPPTIAALKLKEGETFRVERTRAVGCPSGLLQVYSSYRPGPDRREQSMPGCGNLGAYSIKLPGFDALRGAVSDFDDASLNYEGDDEFGAACTTFTAPDGYAWIALNGA